MAGFLSHVTRVYNNEGSFFFRPPQINWENQVVVITGGASGVGKLLAETLATRNIVVVVLDVKRLESAQDNIRSYICDVSDYSQVQIIAKKIEEEVGQPTILVNNAGIVVGKLLLDLTEEDVRKTYGVNVLSHFWTIQAFLPAMIAKGSGHIVTVSSVLGMMGCAQMTDYCSSKAALITFHDSLRFEIKNRYKTPSIRTTLLLPGHIMTDLFGNINLPQNRLFRFFAPSLQPRLIVKQIISALDDQEGRVIRMPLYTNFARVGSMAAGLVPGWGRDFCQWMSNADHSMEGHVQSLAKEKEL